MKRLLSRIRFLPITIFAATLMLTVKIGDIWDGFDGLINGTIRIADAVAQTEQKTAQPDAAAPAAEGAPADAADKAPAADQPPAEPSKLITEDPTLLTQSEIDLLQQLAERRRVLESREQELEIRTGLLSAAETRIDKKVEELKVLRETISGLIKTFDEQQDAKLLSLVKIYENMKPKDAATIFEDLEMDTLLEVAERMKERKLAPIMAKMNPEKAREVTVELARLRQLPLVGEQVGG
ncbi:MAG: MotE family protein [Rhodospirillales bacterium]